MVFIDIMHKYPFLSETFGTAITTMSIIILSAFISIGTNSSLLTSFSSTFTNIEIITTPLISTAYAQQYLQTIKYRNIVIDLDNGLKTNAQLTIPAVGKGPYPRVLLIQGSGALDMNETQGIIHIDNKTGKKKYPPTPFFQIANYLSERGFAVLRYDKRGVDVNVTILNSNVWGNLTSNDLKRDAEKALNVLIQQPEVDVNRITVLGHSEGSVIAPLVTIDNYHKVKNIVLMGAEAQNFRDILYFQHIGIPLLYAEQVLDKNHNLSLTVDQVLHDPILQFYIHEANVIDINNDNYISINYEIHPALSKYFQTIINDIYSSSSLHEKCTDKEGCALLLRSHLSTNDTLNIIQNIPSNIGILILQGENDTFTPVEQAFLIQQKLTNLKHPNHTLITYPNLGHYFYPTSQWIEKVGPIQEYVLADLYSWLEAHSGLSNVYIDYPSTG